MATKKQNGRIQCLVCGDIIESYHRHDYKHCSCGNAMIDGGSDYLRYGWKKEHGKDSVKILNDPYPRE